MQDSNEIQDTPGTLPALRIEVTGTVTASNLAEFKASALALIRGVNTDLQTDSDFADAEKAVKWAKDVEVRLEAAKEQALSQTESIEALFNAIDEIRGEARDTRLTLEKAIKERKEAIRKAIALDTRTKWLVHIDGINAGLGKVRLPDVEIDIATAMKGKRTVKTLRDAADTELARAKIAASEKAKHIHASLEILRTEAQGHESLFADAQHLVQKAHDDLRAAITARVSEHKAAEAKRLAEAEAAMRERLEREARQKAEAEQREKERKERYDAAAERIAAPPPAATPAAPKAEAKPVTPGRVWAAVTAEFIVEIGQGTSDAAVEKALRGALEKAGITTLQSIRIERQSAEEAA